MNFTQIKNIYTYTGIMLLDNFIITTSPDYLKEKTLKFFHTLGKDEFIEFPKIKFKNQISKIYPIENGNFWKTYCQIWNNCPNNSRKIEEDYELMNIINFLLSVYPIYVENDRSLTIRQFEKYIGDIDIISKNDLSYVAHEKIIEFINTHMSFNNRYFKLLILNSIE